MRAMVFQGPGQPALTEVPDPEITDDADIIVRVEATSICGTDLHVLAGDVPSVRAGRILGHEAVGTVADAGSAVRTMGPGDRVLVPCISACGACRFCREGHYGQCQAGGGWILGRTYDGTQAEYVRVPFADTSAYRLPDGVGDDEALMLADVLPTGYEVGVLRAGVWPGDVVAVIGTGPVGLAAILGARLFSPSHIVAVDHADARLDAARLFGADLVVNNATADPLAIVRPVTGGIGADVVIEAVGQPDSFELAVQLGRPGARIANIGMHGKPAVLHLEDQWLRDITITTGLVDTSSIPALLRLLASGQLDVQKLITHRFTFDDFEQAYDVFARPADTGAVKVVVSPQG
jgi:alcohol dehydrogenase